MMGLSWGNGFVTDRNVIQSRGLSDANGFFQRLVIRPYAKRVRLAHAFLCVGVCVCVGGGSRM
jgi:hypothetical protein